MKKFSISVLLSAMLIFAFVFSVSAQADLPAIDETAAADYLGTWYVDQFCLEGQECIAIPAESAATLTIGLDNTFTVQDPEFSYTQNWFMEDGTAYVVDPKGEDPAKRSVLSIDENGALVLKGEGFDTIYVREEPVPAAPASPVTDAVPENFAGQWYLNGFLFDGRVIDLGISDPITLTVNETSFTLSNGTDPDEVYESTFENGKLNAKAEGKDDQGQPVVDSIVAEYYDNDSIYLTFSPNTEDETTMVFTREQTPAADGSLTDAIISWLENADGAEIRDAVTPILQQVQENVNLDELKQELSGLEEKVPEINNILDTLTTTNENGETQLNINGLLDMFGLGK